MESHGCYMMILIILYTIAIMFFAEVKGQGGWDTAHATFYGDEHGVGTMEGACGYGDLFQQGYGLETTALSSALYDDGLTCGACYEIKCDTSDKLCHPGSSIIVTATNFCPSGGFGWCNPPNKHFDLSEPMFLKIADYKAGIVPVQYRRVPCVKKGGIKFEISGNPWFILVLVYNVGGAGDVHGLAIKGTNTDWIQMTRNWGQKWQTGTQLTGQTLSFQVTTSDGKVLESDDVAPPNWEFGKTYEGRNNF